MAIAQEGFREHPRLFVEHAIKQEADKRHPATKERCSQGISNTYSGWLSQLTFQTRAIRLRHGLIFKDTIGKGHAELIQTLGEGGGGNRSARESQLKRAVAPRARLVAKMGQQTGCRCCWAPGMAQRERVGNHSSSTRVVK